MNPFITDWLKLPDHANSLASVDDAMGAVRAHIRRNFPSFAAQAGSLFEGAAGAVSAAAVAGYTADALGASIDAPVSIHDQPFGAVGDGTTLDDPAFALAASLGRPIKLIPGRTYYLSRRVTCVTGTKFVCAGTCTIKLKTGPGGFDNVSLNTNKSANAVFFFSGTDDNAVEGIKFTTDGVREVTIYPIRSLGGFGSVGIDIRRVKFRGLSLISGGYISINSCGAGAYRVNNVEAVNCGSAQGPSYWTGTPQVTVFEVDNDIIPGVFSAPGYGSNIRGTNILLTGSALKAWGQQTDIVNIIGMGEGEHEGPMINGIHADGVGEVVDLFCTGARISGVRARNVHYFVAKFIHGAQDNQVSVDFAESTGLAVVVFAGSSSAHRHTQNNLCHVRVAKGIGDAGDGPRADNASVVAFYENHGSIETCLPRNNVCIVDSCSGGANFDNVVYDNCGVDNANGNRVEVREVSGFKGKSCIVSRGSNTRFRNKSAQACQVRMSTDEALPPAGETTAVFDQAVSDGDGLALAIPNTIRPKFPGWYLCKASIRVDGPGSEYFEALLLKGRTPMAYSVTRYGSGGLETIHELIRDVYIAEHEIGTPSVDLSIRLRHNGPHATMIRGTSFATFFEMLPLARA